jgi:lipopolysaccharide transport system permease protein
VATTITKPEAELGAMTEPEEVPAVTIIEPSSGFISIDWKELWRYRELFYFLTWRDVKIRYKQTVLGAAWAVLQPVLTMLVFTIFFGRLAHIDKLTGGIPYPIFVFAGLLPWTFFANAVTNSSNSLIGSTNLITKVYFPRLIVPLSAVGAWLVDLAVSFCVLLFLMAWYHVPLTWAFSLLPVFILGTILVASGVGCLLSALIVSYRDFRYVVPFLLQIWMFVSPVIFPPGIVPAKWQWVFSLNPMSGLIGGIRSSVLGGAFDWPNVLISVFVSILVFIFGASYFRRVERGFVDII